MSQFVIVPPVKCDDHLLRLHLSMLTFAIKAVREEPRSTKNRAELLNLLVSCQTQQIEKYNIMQHQQVNVKVEYEKRGNNFYIHYDDLGIIAVNKEQIRFVLEPSWIRQNMMLAAGSVSAAIPKAMETFYTRTEDLPTRSRRLLRLLQCDMIQVISGIDLAEPELEGHKTLSVTTNNGNLEVQEIRSHGKLAVSRAVSLIGVNLGNDFKERIYKLGVPLDVHQTSNANATKNPEPVL